MNKLDSTSNVPGIYDERTDERVILIEYRVREKGALKTTPQGRQQRRGQLLRQLYAIASQG